MTVESGHEPTEWESGPRPISQPAPPAQTVHYNSARHGSHVEESPELLRWRADLLMDEMMMGGVDVSAADGNRTFSGVDAPVVQRPQSPSNGGSNSGANGGSYASDHGRSPRDSYERNPYENNNRIHGGNSNTPGNGSPSNGTQSTESHRSTESGRPSEINGGDYPNPSARNDAPNEPRSLSPNRATIPESRPDVGSSRAYEEPLRQPPTRPTPPTSPANGSYTASGYDKGSTDNGAMGYGFDDERDSRSGSDEPPPLQSMLRTTMDGAPSPSSDDQTARTDRFYSADAQYEPPRREPSSTNRPVEAAPPATATRPPLTPLHPPSRQPVTPPRVTPQPVDQHTQWATGPDKWEYQDFSSNPEEEEPDPFLSAYPAPDRRPAQESGVRNDPAQFVSAMSVMGSNKKRSTLLPRSSTLDVDTLHREISDLHGEIAALLPVGNETGERARHLLDKAYSILQSDPMRSAEVEYYMQQVRTIVQRLYQARQWSDLYRQRLHVYLWGWLGLSAVLLVARFIFQIELEEAMMWILGVDADNLFVTHWATFVGTAFAGALGGAIGALYTMQTHARGEYSFFDRKYGLRGLILPFMGLIIGALGYFLFGLVFALVGIDPSQSLTAAIVPTMAAFAFGFSQESIYGTRN